MRFPNQHCDFKKQILIYCSSVVNYCTVIPGDQTILFLEEKAEPVQIKNNNTTPANYQQSNYFFHDKVAKCFIPKILAFIVHFYKHFNGNT